MQTSHNHYHVVLITIDNVEFHYTLLFTFHVEDTVQKKLKNISIKI
jgi:hypothetical protein